MATPKSFRSALNGFNREDVVHYIEYLNARHTSEINQLNAELEQAHAQLTVVQDDPQAAPLLTKALEDNAALEARLAEREAELEALKARCQALENAQPAAAAENAPSAQLEERCQSLEAQLRDAIAARIQAENERDAARASAVTYRVEQELEAYRRAERTERVARERAEQVYRQANGALADATVKVDDAFSQIGGLADQVSQQLAQLQFAIQSSKQALADASATLYTIRPGTDKM